MCLSCLMAKEGEHIGSPLQKKYKMSVYQFLITT